MLQRRTPVSRDDAAAAVGISRPLAAYHLDKLLHDGLLEARYQHRSGRRGPGAGRPAKHYVPAPTPIELSLPTPTGHPDQSPTTLRQALAARGYQPYQDPDGTIRPANCPFDRIATHHRDLVCGANQAMLQALTDHLHPDPPSRPPSTPNPDAAVSPSPTTTNQHPACHGRADHR